jgi:molybdenum-dependent DNA-binding transcriptional regulator ModE
LTKFGEELVDRYRELEREFGTLATRRLESITASVTRRSKFMPNGSSLSGRRV